MPVLYINSRKVDLPDGFKISINKELENFNEPAAVRNSYSVQITLDGTKNNNDIFSSFNLPNAISQVYGNRNDLPSRWGKLTTTFNPNKKNQFVLLDDQGQIFQRGYVRYDESVTKGNTTQYKITLFGELGDVIYNLMYDDSGNKKNLANLKYYPFDYPVNTVNGVPNQIDSWDDVKWNAKYIKKVWDESSIYVEDKNYYILQEPKNKYIMPVLTKRGPIANFDANKITVSYIGMPNVPANTYYSDVTRLMPPVVIDTEQQTVSTTLSGKCQFEYERDLDFKEVGAVCAQSVTPSFYLPAIIEACCNPDNNGGYTINISSKIKENAIYYDKQFVLMKNLTFDTAPEGVSVDINKEYVECPDMNKINVWLTGINTFPTTYIDFLYPSLYTTWNFGFQISRNEFNGMRDNQISLNRRQNGNFMFGGVLVRLYVVNEDNNELNHKWYYITSNTISGNIVEEGKETITNLLRKDDYGNYMSIEFATFDQTLKTLYTNREEIEYTTFPDWQTFVTIIDTNLNELKSPNVDLNLPYSNLVPGNQRLGYRMDAQFVGVRVTQSNIQGRNVYSSSILTQQYVYGNHGGAVVPCVMTNFINNSKLNPEPDYITNVVLNNRDGDKIDKNWNTIITKEKFFEGSSTPADYLLSLMKLYNLYLISDYTKEKTLNLVTVEEFYRLKYSAYEYWGEDVYKETEDEIPTVVLDDKVDYSQPVVIKPYIFSSNLDVLPNHTGEIDYGSRNIITPRGAITQETEKIFTNTNFLDADNLYTKTKYYNRTNVGNTRYWPMPLLPGKYKQYLYRMDDEGVIQEQEYERFGVYNNQFVYNKTNPKTIEYEVNGINNKGEDVDLMNALVDFRDRYIRPGYVIEKITLYDAEDSIVNNSNAANLLGLWSSKDGYGKTILHTVDRYPMGYSGIDIRQKYHILKNLNTDIQQTVTLYIKINVSNIDELFRNIYQWQNNLYIITKCENITIGGEQPIKITMVRIPYKNFTV